MRSSGIDNILHSTGIGVVIRNVFHQHVFSYHWVDEGIHRKTNQIEQKKRLERQKKEREQQYNRKLKSQKTNRISLPQIINQQIIAKLSKNVKFVLYTLPFSADG